jgi:hypothetical protein
VLPAGTFHHWMQAAGRLGNQVPRVTNRRVVADGLLAVAEAGDPPPAPATTAHRAAM